MASGRGSSRPPCREQVVHDHDDIARIDGIFMDLQDVLSVFQSIRLLKSLRRKFPRFPDRNEPDSEAVGKNRALAKKIDALAKKAKVAVLGTGVNPGFAMDALPITLQDHGSTVRFRNIWVRPLTTPGP